MISPLNEPPPPPQAVLTCHYSVHCGFLGESELLPDAMPTLRRIPCVAFQGANDMICPPATASALRGGQERAVGRGVDGATSSTDDGAAAGPDGGADDGGADACRSGADGERRSP